jgi:hypothetical protein
MCIALGFLTACGGGVEQSAENEADVQDSIEEAAEVAQEEETEQTDDQRIAEIKTLYAQIQNADKKQQKCTRHSLTTYDGLMESEQYPFENTVEECRLPKGLKYRTLTVNGYESSITAHYYFQDGHLFFIFVDGGAEACAFQYRLYYDRKGALIRILSAENDCDGDAPGKQQEVKNPQKREEILSTLDYCEERYNEILTK